jgi:putative membrane protein
MGPEYFWGSGMWIFPIIMLVVILLVIYLIFGRGRMVPPWYDNDRHYHRHDMPNTALEILKERYAKGEITKEQFGQMKKDILS